MKGTELPIRTTPFPNVLIDVFMPQLSDTEWRILSVVVRQTLGWRNRETNERKRCDWMTQSQLKARTGRESAAISAAIDQLVKRKLIECRREDGEPLHSAEARRQYRGR